MSRREWLRIGALSSAGLTLPMLWRGRAQASSDQPQERGFGKAKSCIVVFLFGGPAHQDIWDPKPAAPSEVRGEFQVISTATPGVYFGEHIPRIAQQTSKFALVRSVSHPDNTHTVAMHYMLTGHRHLRPATNPQNEPSDFPTFGAVLRYMRRGQGGLPSGISLNSPANQVSANNHIFPGFFAGLLGQAHDPLFVSADPSQSPFCPFPMTAGAETARLSSSYALLESLRDKRLADLRQLETTRPVREFHTYHEQAFELLTSATTREAFELTAERPELRDRYGRTAFGQALLLARRLVERGVSLVTVNWARDDAFWDTHSDNFQRLKDSLLPPFDLGFSALLDDLEQRGLLEETLVVCLGEFGRTPKINAQAGRDHWAACNSVVFAGGGICGGQILGASDEQAAYPTTAPVSPADLSATIYHALGIDIRSQVRDQFDRPLILSDGHPLVELFG
jgi:hypothetical protein